jgi:hypothetical protein
VRLSPAQQEVNEMRCLEHAAGSRQMQRFLDCPLPLILCQPLGVPHLAENPLLALDCLREVRVWI